MLELLSDEGLAGLASADLVDELRTAEREIARWRATQVRLLRELQRRRAHGLGAGRVAGWLDISTGTAGALLETARRTPEESPQMEALETGGWSFDRAEAMARLRAAGADQPTLEGAGERDIAGVHKLRAMTRRVRRRDEHQAATERFLRCHPSLDASVGFIHGQLPALDWGIVDRALDVCADTFPPEARTVTSRGQRRADALVAIAQNWLDGHRGHSRPAPLITVMVDAATAATTGCETGAALTAGPRIGPDTLDRIICEGDIEIVIDPISGTPLAVGPTTRVVPPKMRRFVLNRDDGCTIDGCTNRYRLEIHHITPRSQGGTHDPANLTTLCWWHHQIGIHLQHQHIDPDSPPHRRRITPTDRHEYAERSPP